MDAAANSAVPPAGAVVVEVDVAAAAPVPWAQAAAPAPWARAAAAAPPARAAAPPGRATAPPPARGPEAPPARGTAPRPARAPEAPPARGTASRPAARAPAAQRARAAAARQALERRISRAAVAMGLFVLGLAAAALGLFVMTLRPADYASPGPCFPTDAEAADLRTASKLLLVDAATQALAASAALLMPTEPFPLAAALGMGLINVFGACDVFKMLVACHDHVGGVFVVHYWAFLSAMAMFLGLIAVHGLKMRRN